MRGHSLSYGWPALPEALGLAFKYLNSREPAASELHAWGSPVAAQAQLHKKRRDAIQGNFGVLLRNSPGSPGGTIGRCVGRA
eukprot:6204644-Pleurochrysis_carterae.AAC.1